MKNIIYIINFLFIVLLFIACGSQDTQEGDNINNIKVINCDLSNNDGTNDCNGYTCINENDTLISNTNDTVLEIIHLGNNEKKACAQSGSAHILR